MKTDELCLTFDLDWCSDEVLDYLLSKLIKYKVPATFFVTHETILLDKIRKYSFFELGIHPNFMDNSTHGDNFKDVINYCLKLVPEAISSRSHGLYISSNKLMYMMECGVKIDCSIFMPRVDNLQNFYFKINDKKILRVPYNWEDDYEFYQENKQYCYEQISSFKNKILDFHPIHIYLNSNSDKLYCTYKIDKNVKKNTGIGSEVMLNQLIEEHKKGKITIVNLKTYVGIK